MSKTTEKKMTKRDYFNDIMRKYPLTEGEKNFVLHELELLDKKNSAERKPTERQTENSGIAEAVLSTMTAEPNRLFTIGELIKEVPGIPEDMTPQRMSAILRNMGDAVTKTYEKRKAYFSAN